MEMRVPTLINRWQVWTTVSILALTTAATVLGLFVDGFYKDPDALRLQAYGQDLVTLTVILPALVVGLVAARRGSLRGYLLWLGALGYLAYTYLVYAVITEFNWFFLGYVAVFGLSSFTFASGLLQTDADAVKQRLTPQLPATAVATFLAAMALVVGLLWLSEAVPATFSNTKPPSVAAFDIPANVIHVLDLGLLIPATVVTAHWLRRGIAWGYVLAGVLLVKVVSISLAVLAMIAWMATHGETVAVAEIGVFALVTIIGLGVGVVYFRAITPAGAADSTPGHRPPVS